MNKRVTVIGVGYIGLPTSIVLAGAGCFVHGFDLNPTTVEKLNCGICPIDEPGLQEELTAFRDRMSFSCSIEPADVFYICAPTPLKNEDGKMKFNDTFVKAAATSVAQVIKEGNLVILESTVAPGTTRMLAGIISKISGLHEDSFFMAHCPERVIPGRMLRELRENDRIIGATSEEGARLAKEIYQSILTKGSIEITDDVTAELSKLVENAYRDVNIAFANELSVICNDLGVDVTRLIELANMHPRVNIHTPGVGVGGHCIPVVPWFICEKFPEKTPLMQTARRVNDDKTVWVAKQIAEKLGKDRRLCVLGATYKPDVDDLRDSPSLTLTHILRTMGFDIRVCEPNVKISLIDGFENITLEEAVGSNDFLVITLAHKQFLNKKDLISACDNYDCVGLLK